MQFFSASPDDDSPAHPTRAIPEWSQPPADEIPVPVATTRVLSRASGVALSLRRIDVYSNGCSFRLQADARREDDLNQDHWDDIVDALSSHRQRHRDLDERMRFGVTLSDGRTATADRGRRLELDDGDDPNGPLLSVHHRGGGGSDHDYEMGYRL